ncbi:MAG: HD domain-containing protein [Desulfovibrio sp.]|nr:MAG: HD domain-containing protein [Desulfovibrio sp.]
MNDLLAEHTRGLVEFASAYRRGSEQDLHCIDLKIDHSLRVLGLAQDIAASLALEEDRKREVLLAALYHDIGRFPQYDEYKTFHDADSVNHAALGVKCLRGGDFLRELPTGEQRTIRAAVMLHNRRALPQGISEHTRLAAWVVRDADKLDIMRVMLEHLGRQGKENGVVMLKARDEPESHTESIRRQVLGGSPGDYKDLQFVNDFIMLLCGWTHGLRLGRSRELLRERAYIPSLLGFLPRNPAMAEFRSAFSQYCGE